MIRCSFSGVVSSPSTARAVVMVAARSSSEAPSGAPPRRMTKCNFSGVVSSAGVACRAVTTPPAAAAAPDDRSVTARTFRLCTVEVAA